MIIITTCGPLGFVPVGFMATAIDHTAGLQNGIDGMQIGFKTEPGVSGDGIHLQIGINGFDLQKQAALGISSWPLAGRTSSNRVTLKRRIGICQAQRQAAVAIAGFAIGVFGCIRAGGVVGLSEDWLETGVPDKTGLWVAWSGWQQICAQARLSQSQPRRSLSLAGQCGGFLG